MHTFLKIYQCITFFKNTSISGLSASLGNKMLLEKGPSEPKPKHTKISIERLQLKDSY